MSGPSEDLPNWVAIYHAALKAGHQEDAATAFEHIAHLNRAGTLADTGAASAEEDARSPLEQAADVPLAAGLGAAQGATLGFAGRLSPSFKTALAGAREREPLATTTGDVAGSLLLPGSVLPSKTFAFAKPVVKLAATGLATGATMGGVRGMNEAEEGHRGEGATTGAIIGGALGLAPAAIKAGGAIPRRLISGIDKAWGSEAPAAATAAVSKAPTKQGPPPKGFLDAFRQLVQGKDAPAIPTAPKAAPMSPAARARFEQAFGERAPNAEVLETGTAPASGGYGRKPMNLSTSAIPQGGKADTDLLSKALAETQVREPILNPRTGEPITPGEVQDVIDKEQRINAEVKARKQRSSPGAGRPWTKGPIGRETAEIPPFSKRMLDNASPAELRTKIEMWTRQQSGSPELIQYAKDRLAAS